MEYHGVIFLLLVASKCVHAIKKDVTIVTKAGTFVGFEQEVNVDGDTALISKFLGIPYAEPPVGDRRFRKPVAKAPLEEPMMTTEHGPECIQMEFFPSGAPTSEDCLFLNVYRPAGAGGGAGLAVLVWLHGGGFVMGSAGLYRADSLAARGHVLVVTLNYRLSVLGFLNVGDENSPGNYGLWDQRLALQWVHQYIAAFGGDPDRVTIFGESAGAASVVFQGLYPGNRGLFQRILAQSGTASSPWAFTRSYKDEAREVAALVGCSTDSTNAMVDCLRQTDVDTLRAVLNDFSNGLLRVPFPLGPSFDGEFMTVSPDKYFDIDDTSGEEARATLATFDVLIGMNEAEGAGYINPMIGIDADPDDFFPNSTYFRDVLVPIALKPVFGEDIPEVIKDLVIAEYTDWNDPENPVAIREQYITLQGDINFLAPLYSTVSSHVSLSQRGMYVYRFAVNPSAHVVETPIWSKKANHGDELQFVFGGDIDFSTWGIDFVLTDSEKEISKQMMTLWTNFAKTGDPNNPTNLGLAWRPYTPENRRYLEITGGLGAGSVRERLCERRAHFLSHLLPAVHGALGVRGASGHAYSDTCTRDGACAP